MLLKLDELIDKDYISRTQVFEKENFSNLFKCFQDDVKKDISDHYRKKFFKTFDHDSKSFDSSVNATDYLDELIDEDEDNKMSFLNDLDKIFIVQDEFMDFVEEYKHEILISITE
tara:strand:+ start:363 stop:707 length:345 start_codon:yes stop_codon:yes gene_type:complete